MAGASFAGGVAEALFLITVTRAAFAITDGDDRIGIVSGWYVTVPVALLLGLTFVVLRLGFSAFASWNSARLSAQVVADVRNRLASAFLGASWTVQQSQRGGSLQELLTTYSNQASFLMGSFSQGVLASANLIALLLMAIAVDPLGALVLVTTVGILGLLLRPLRAAVRRRAREVTAAGMEFATSVNEVSQLGLEVHIFHVQDAARHEVTELVEQTRSRAAHLQFLAGLTAPIYTGLAYLALLGALALVAASNTTTLTSLGAAMLVMLRSLSYGQALQSSHTNVSSTTPAIEALQEQLDIFEAGRRRTDGERVEAIGQVVADGVWFAYPGGPDVLRGVSFTIDSREIVGIVGPSGVGKSTLVELLLGLRDPSRGAILMDGRDIGDLDPSTLARRVTFVPQVSHLVTGSIAANISFLRDGFTQDDIEAAAKLAHVHEDIVGFGDGYEHRIGDHGSRLSGGQAQRLCIARALLEKPDVMILDEPTSALDVRSEHLIRTTLLGLKERMTVIVIAHRLSTLDICDRIMVIQDGEIRGFDTPSNLERSSDFYREALVLSGLR